MEGKERCVEARGCCGKLGERYKCVNRSCYAWIQVPSRYVLIMACITFLTFVNAISRENYSFFFIHYFNYAWNEKAIRKIEQSIMSPKYRINDVSDLIHLIVFKIVMIKIAQFVLKSKKSN